MTPRICNLPGCGRPVGLPPYSIAGRPEDLYCSRACVDKAWEQKLHELKRSRKKTSSDVSVEAPEPVEEDGTPMEVHADDFGEANVTRAFCDRKECGNAIALSWRGRYGVYCSNTCLKISEREGNTTMTTDDTTATATVVAPEKPIKAGAPAPKKGAVKTAKKTAKKTAPPAKSKAAAKAPAKKPPAKSDHDEAYTPRTGSKFEILLNLLKRAKGASVEEMAEAVGWGKSAIGAGLFNLRKHNLNIQKGEDGRFRLTA